MPGRFALKPTLAKIWHAPDNFRLMDPLPPMHRRGIIIAAALVGVGILLPTPDGNDAPPAQRDAQIDLPTQSSPQPQPVEQPPLVNEPAQSLPQNPEPQMEQEPVTQEAAPLQEPVGIEQQWRTYRIESGKTLAQLFRDHNLPPTDVYAMAQVEGSGKPLSSLQTGQIVTGLTIEGEGNQQVLFTRQPDGSFIRAQ